MATTNGTGTDQSTCRATCKPPPPPPNPSPPFAPGQLDLHFRVCFSGAVTQAAGVGDVLKACWLPYGMVLVALILVGLTMYVDKAVPACTLALASVGAGRGASGRGKHTLLDKCR